MKVEESSHEKVSANLQKKLKSIWFTIQWFLYTSEMKLLELYNLKGLSPENDGGEVEPYEEWGQGGLHPHVPGVWDGTDHYQ